MNPNEANEDIEDLFKEGDEDAKRLKVKPAGVKKKTRPAKETEQTEDYDQDFVREVPGTQKIYVKTFGCSHNISDSEFMMGQLVEYGYKLVDSLQECDLTILNSCTVKNPSQEAFITIVENAKKLGKRVVVAGCVPEGDKNIPQIQDCSVIGLKSIDRVVEVVSETLKGHRVRLNERNKKLPTLTLPKIRKNKFVEIIPINTGCLGACTYCKTVHARGKLGSYSVEEIVNRQKQAIAEGVKEIWITSEDTGAYGKDIGTNIVDLLENMVNALPKDVMLRIGMTNPPYILEHLENIVKILKHPNVYAFLHVPVQSGNNEVLDRMNREYTVEDFRKVGDAILSELPDMTVATDIICGFPYETDANFEDTMNLVRHYRFPVLNISQFYPRPGTAAAKMPKVNTKDVKERSRNITKLFESYTCYDKYLHTEQLVMISDKEFHKTFGKFLVGHTKNYVKTIIRYEEEALEQELIGKMVKVKITKTLKWNLEAEVIDRAPFIPEPPKLALTQTSVAANKKKARATSRREDSGDKKENAGEASCDDDDGACGSGCCKENADAGSCSKGDDCCKNKKKNEKAGASEEHRVLAGKAKRLSIDNILMVLGLAMIAFGVLASFLR